MAEGVVGVQPAAKEAQRGLPTLWNYLRGGCSEVGAGVFLQGRGDRTGANGLRVCWGRFILAGKKMFLTEQFVKGWNGLLMETLKSPCLEVCERCLDVAFRDRSYWCTWQRKVHGWTG